MDSVQQKNRIQDECVLYYSKDDECWVAHSLRMDQIGTGERILDALADLLRAVDFVVQDAIEDKTLAVLREAPQEIQVMRNSAIKLPREIFEVAHKMAHGCWPEEAPLTLGAREDHPYIAEIEEQDVVTA